jgi:chromosome condensin MukBEF complex kleisin-like MukF subunit
MANGQKHLERIVEAFASENSLESIWHERWVEEFADAMAAVLNVRQYENPKDMEADPDFQKVSERLATIRQQLLAVMQLNNLSAGEGLIVMFEFCISVLAIHEFSKGSFLIDQTLRDLGLSTKKPTDTSIN